MSGSCPPGDNGVTFAEVDESHRVSNAEREQTVVLLRHHLLEGRLTLDEFSERVELVYGAKVGQDLIHIRQDLPDVLAGRAGSRRKPTRFVGALLSHVIRRGRLRLRGWTLALSVLANIDLDLREAEIDNAHTTVNVLVAFGNVDIYVPEGVNVDVGGFSLFGRRREWGSDTARTDAPTVQVRTLSWFGTIDVWRVPPDLRGTYGRIFRKLKKRQRRLPA